MAPNARRNVLNTPNSLNMTISFIRQIWPRCECCLDRWINKQPVIWEYILTHNKERSIFDRYAMGSKWVRRDSFVDFSEQTIRYSLSCPSSLGLLLEKIDLHAVTHPSTACSRWVRNYFFKSAFQVKMAKNFQKLAEHEFLWFVCEICTQTVYRHSSSKTYRSYRNGLDEMNHIQALGLLTQKIRFSELIPIQNVYRYTFREKRIFVLNRRWIPMDVSLRVRTSTNPQQASLPFVGSARTWPNIDSNVGTQIFELDRVPRVVRTTPLRGKLVGAC